MEFRLAELVRYDGLLANGHLLTETVSTCLLLLPLSQPVNKLKKNLASILKKVSFKIERKK